MHHSNSLPDIRIAASRASALEGPLLLLGQVLTLNTIQTKEGWLTAAYVVGGMLLLQLALVARSVLKKRQHLRALEDVKKM